METKPAINPWLIASVVLLATFMEVLDTSVANVALPHIASAISRPARRRKATLGADGVSRRQRDRAAAERVVLDPVRTEALLHGVRRHLHPQFPALRRGADARLADLLSRPAGPGRRSAAADLPGDSGRELPAREAGRRDGVLRHGRGRGAGDRADAGRMDHRQLHLALDLPDQHTRRHPVARIDGGDDLRSAAPGQEDAGQRAEARLHRNRPAQHRPRLAPRSFSTKVSATTGSART